MKTKTVKTTKAKAANVRKVDLDKTLKSMGIQPLSFGYFLTEFIESKHKPKTRLAVLLTRQLQSEAELIRYHLSKQRD